MSRVAVGAGIALVAGTLLLRVPSSPPAPTALSRPSILKRMARDGKQNGSLDADYVRLLARDFKLDESKAWLQAILCKEMLNRYARRD